jgi:hypothetical protein
LIYQTGDRPPLVEGYHSRKLHFLGAYFPYFPATLLFQWELWAHYVLCMILFLLVSSNYDEYENREFFEIVQKFDSYVLGFLTFFLGLFVSLVITRYTSSFGIMGSIYGAHQNLALELSSCIQPNGPNDPEIHKIRKQLKNWTILGFTIMALQSHYSKDEWLDYLLSKGYMTKEEWQLMLDAKLSKYDKGGVVYVWIANLIAKCGRTGRIQHADVMCPTLIKSVGVARGSSLSFDFNWIVQLPYAYVSMVSSMVKMALVTYTTLMGMQASLISDVRYYENLGPLYSIPTHCPLWLVQIIGCFTLFVLHFFLYSAVSLHGILENPWGSPQVGMFKGGGQHRSHLPFEEFVWLLETRVRVFFNQGITMRPIHQD